MPRGSGRARGLHGQIQPLAPPVHADPEFTAHGRFLDGPRECLKLRERLPVERKDAIAGQETRKGGGPARSHARDNKSPARLRGSAPSMGPGPSASPR